MSMCDRIQAALRVLEPKHIEVHDESHMHSRGLESHFKVVLVSPQFAGLSAVKRHQKVYATLSNLMDRLHALALHTFTPDEWSQAAVPASPVCWGGSEHGKL